MREILFRGKQLFNCDWTFGGFHSRFGESFIIGISKTMRIDVIQVYTETVGQYTGVTDKNGNKIFEGDILLFDYTGKNSGVNGKASVLFENGKFGVKWGTHNEFVCLDGFANTTIEVIGNIHDNPELLGGAE